MTDLPANTVVGRLGIGPGPAESIPFETLTTDLLGAIDAPNSLVIGQGPGVYSFTANYGPQNNLAGTYHIITNGSIATPTTSPAALLIVQKNSAVTGLNGTPNPNPAVYFSLTKNTNSDDRGCALFCEAQDFAGSDQGFIEGIRTHAVLSGGVDGEAYGLVSTASSISVGYTELVCMEAQLFNASGTDAPATFNGTTPPTLAVGFLAENDGANFADAAYLVNPYSIGKFRRGFVVGNNSIDQVAFSTYATTQIGLALHNGVQTYAAIAIGNNARISWRNQADTLDLTMMLVNTNDILDVGMEARTTNIGRIANVTTGLTLSSAAPNDNIAITTSRNRIAGPVGAFSVTGFNYTPGVSDGQRIYLHNATNQQMTLVNAAGSAAANQILTLTGANVVLRAGPSFATFSYDTVVSKWILESTN